MGVHSTKNMEIERLRAFAVLLTIMTHVHPKNFPHELFVAWGGVDLFFVISGFVITNSLLALLPAYSEESTFLQRLDSSRAALKIFFTKRIYRIVPLAVAVAVLSFVFNASTQTEIKGLLRETVGLLSGFYNYSLAANMHPREAYSVYWSLAVEEHFYATFPFFLIAAATLRRRVIFLVVSVLAVAFVIRPLATAGVDFSDWVQWRASTHLRADPLMVGALIALGRSQGIGDAFTTGSKKILSEIVFVLLCGLWLSTALLDGDHPKLMPYLLTLLWMVSGGLVFLASLEKGVVLNFPILRGLLEYVGSRSYSLYLSHYLTYHVMLYMQGLLIELYPSSIDKISNFASIPVIYVAIFIFAEALHRTVEIPFMQRGSERVKKLAVQNPVLEMQFPKHLDRAS